MRFEVEAHEVRHFLECETVDCPRCRAFLVEMQLRDRRRVNMIFSTIWVGLGLWGLVVIICRIIGR